MLKGRLTQEKLGDFFYSVMIFGSFESWFFFAKAKKSRGAFITMWKL